MKVEKHKRILQFTNQNIYWQADSSDEDIKGNRNSDSPEYLHEMVTLDTNSEEHFATTEEEIMSMNSEIIIMDSNMKSSDDRLHTTSEDFEAMIDSGNSKDGKESNSSIELMEIEPSVSFFFFFFQMN